MRSRIIFKILFVTAGVAIVSYCLSSIYFYYQEKPEAVQSIKKYVSQTKVPIMSSLHVIRYQDDVIIKIPLTQIQVPKFFFIQVVTKNKHRVIIDQTVWQPAFLSKF